MNKTYLFLTFFVIFVSPSSSQEELLVDGVFAVVGDHVIYHSDIDNQVTQYQTQGVFSTSEKDLRNQIIEDLFFQKILLNIAAQDSIQIEPSELENSVNQRIMFFKEQLGSENKVEKYFNKSIPKLVEELKPIIKNQILIQKMQYEIIKNVDVSPLEVQNYFHSFNLDSLPLIPAQFQVAQILKVPVAATLALEETLKKLEDLRNRIVNGADFSTMAILYSEDPGSSREGGQYNNIKKGQLVKEFESIVFSLGRGELSEIFETEYGYHIAELIERRGNEIDFRHILMTPKISNNDLLKTKYFLDSLRLEIIDNTLSFTVAAKTHSSDKETRYNSGLLINPQTNNSFFSNSDLDPVVYNEIQKLSIGDITESIYIKLANGEEAYRIIKLVNKIEAHPANLEQDYTFLKDTYHTIKEEQVLQKWYKKKIQDLHVHSYEDLSGYEFYKNLLENE